MALTLALMIAVAGWYFAFLLFPMWYLVFCVVGSVLIWLLDPKSRY